MKGSVQDRQVLKEIEGCFPDWSDKTEELYLKNKNFREAIQDYIFCKQKITGISQETFSERALKKLYEETLKELEKDIREYLAM